MNGTLTRSVGSDLHRKLQISTDLKRLTEGTSCDVQPDEAASYLVKMGLLVPDAKSPEPLIPALPADKVKGVAKEPAISQGK